MASGIDTFDTDQYADPEAAGKVPDSIGQLMIEEGSTAEDPPLMWRATNGLDIDPTGASSSDWVRIQKGGHKESVTISGGTATVTHGLDSRDLDVFARDESNDEHGNPDWTYNSDDEIVVEWPMDISLTVVVKAW